MLLLHLPPDLLLLPHAEAVVRCSATDSSGTCSRSCTYGGGKSAVIRTVSKELGTFRMSWNSCIPRERKWDAGEILNLFMPPNQILFLFFFFFSSRVQQDKSDYSLPVQFHLSSHRHLGADIINLFLLHLRMPWDTLQVSSSADTFVPQGEFTYWINLWIYSQITHFELPNRYVSREFE